MELIIDDRERAVIEYLEDLSHDFHIDYKVERLLVGDYALVYKGHIMHIIERKTLSDLAASLRDGRKDNINKLINVRESTGCQLSYLIEGKQFPNPNELFHRIPYKNLRAHLDHIAYRDGIHMLYTKDQQHTAYRLFEFAKNFSTIKPSPFDEIELLIKNKESANEHANVTEKIGGDISKSNQDTVGNQSKLKEKQPSQININEQLLRCIPGVGHVISTLLAEDGISLYTLYHSKHSVEDIARYKFNTGASIGIEKAKKIYDSRRYLTGDSQLAKKIQLRILSTIPGISITTAKKILEVIHLKDIFSGNVTQESLKSIPRTEKTTLGEKASNSIITHLIPQIVNE